MSGATLALIMAMTGRTLYCDELGGDGVPTLRDRDPRKDAAKRAHERERQNDEKKPATDQ
ncbi:MAG: hypothetical protein ACLPKE_03105 [Streptosporangiaceae bacterium]